MVDRLEKLDPNLYRVQEAGDDQRRRQQQQEEKKKKEKDKFEKKGAGWKDLPPQGGLKANPLLGTRPTSLPHFTSPAEPAADEEYEESLTFSERLLVAWGMIDRGGRARVPVILAYLAVMGVITLGTVLIAVFLWR